MSDGQIPFWEYQEQLQPLIGRTLDSEIKEAVELLQKHIRSNPTSAHAVSATHPTVQAVAVRILSRRIERIVEHFTKFDPHVPA